ncbi:hypothetical protein B4135_2628 [Caldibacillus debilis]|uniref:Uncharacterized protein n=1 Tax=Caldibacillus debilis TaxID=301148 RepID=A0A150LW23_9BACI|nr:hypothetical protein B4135_2628 [Caldibacillus debilis]
MRNFIPAILGILSSALTYNFDTRNIVGYEIINKPGLKIYVVS